jgi:flagellar biosynthesis protein FlhB
MAEKTEEATPRRLRKAREEGDAGVSAFAAQALGFVVAVAVAPAAVRALAEHAAGDLQSAIAQAADVHAARFDAGALSVSVLSLALPVALAAGVAAGAAHLVQTGGVLATGKLSPDLSRLDPVAGLGKLLSGTRLFSVARSLVAALVVGWLAVRGLTDHVVDLARVGGRLAWAPAVVADVAGGVAWKAALVGLGLGVIDVLVVRTAWMRRLRMSKDEVRREHKDSEGDPQLKAARERAHHDMMAQATIASVRTASVVVVNPTHLACALRYVEGADGAEGDAAPVVVASGEGDLAQQILRAAEQWGIPVVRDVPLARALIELQVGDVIPEALYEAVAEILRDVWDEQPQAPAQPGDAAPPTPSREPAP